MTIPDDFPTFLPVSKFEVPASPTIAHLDIEHAKRVDAEQWKRDSQNAQAELEIMRAERNRDRIIDRTAFFLIGLAVPVGIIWDLITSLFGA